MRCPPQFGFRDDITFYTAHGDVFGWAVCHTRTRDCWLGLRASLRPNSPIKVRS